MCSKSPRWSPAEPVNHNAHLVPASLSHLRAVSTLIPIFTALYNCWNFESRAIHDWKYYVDTEGGKWYVWESYLTWGFVSAVCVCQALCRHCNHSKGQCNEIIICMCYGLVAMHQVIIKKQKTPLRYDNCTLGTLAEVCLSLGIDIPHMHDLLQWVQEGEWWGGLCYNQQCY